MNEKSGLDWNGGREFVRRGNDGILFLVILGLLLRGLLGSTIEFFAHDADVLPHLQGVG